MTTVIAPANVAVWFEIPAADFDRAVGFYENVLGTTLRRDETAGTKMGIFPYERPAMSGCVIKGDGYKPGDGGPVIYLEAKGDLDGPLARVVKAGGKVALPKTALPPGMGSYAHFVDCEGNRVGLHSVE